MGIYTFKWRIGGTMRTVRALGMSDITDTYGPDSIEPAYQLFSQYSAPQLDRPKGDKVHLLIGLDYNEYLPAGGQGADQVGSLRVMDTPLSSSGKVLTGHHPSIRGRGSNFSASAVAFRKAVFIDSKDLSPQAARSINLVNRQTHTGQVQLSQDTSPPVQTSTDSSQQSGLASDLHPEDAGAQGYGHREAELHRPGGQDPGLRSHDIDTGVLHRPHHGHLPAVHQHDARPHQDPPAEGHLELIQAMEDTLLLSDSGSVYTVGDILDPNSNSVMGGLLMTSANSASPVSASSQPTGQVSDPDQSLLPGGIRLNYHNLDLELETNPSKLASLPSSQSTFSDPRSPTFDLRGSQRIPNGLPGALGGLGCRGRNPTSLEETSARQSRAGPAASSLCPAPGQSHPLGKNPMDGVSSGSLTIAGLTKTTCGGALLGSKGTPVSTISMRLTLGAEARWSLPLTAHMVVCLQAVQRDVCELFQALLPHLQVSERLTLTQDLELHLNSGMLTRVLLHPGMSRTLMGALEQDRRHNTNTYNTIQSSVRGFLNHLAIEAARTDNNSPDPEHISRTRSWLHMATMTMLRHMATAFSMSITNKGIPPSSPEGLIVARGTRGGKMGFLCS